MNHLPYELSFMHKYNLHKLLGLIIDDYDLPAIARIYGIAVSELEEIEKSFDKNLSELVHSLKERAHMKPPLNTPCRALALGDSITSDRESYVRILSRLWEDDPSREIIDCGVSGDTTADIINRFYATALREAFDWAIIFLGTNDCRELDDEAHVSNVGFEEYKVNMSYFTESFLRRDKRVVHVTIPYVDNERLKDYFSDSNWRYSKERIDMTNAFIRDLSRSNRTELADLAQKLQDYEGDVLEQDGLHLNKHGQMILCEILLKKLP